MKEILAAFIDDVLLGLRKGIEWLTTQTDMLTGFASAHIRNGLVELTVDFYVLITHSCRLRFNK